jgi:hypothetical protein
MQGTDMTLKQAFKVWWSYSWRASLLLIPLGLVMTAWSLVGLYSALQSASASGNALSSLLSGRGLSSLNVEALAHLATGGMAAWVISLVLTAVIQVFAMRWALNSRWSDFRLQAVPPEPQPPGSPSATLPGRPG